MKSILFISLRLLILLLRPLIKPNLIVIKWFLLRLIRIWTRDKGLAKRFWLHLSWILTRNKWLTNHIQYLFSLIVFKIHFLPSKIIKLFKIFFITTMISINTRQRYNFLYLFFLNIFYLYILLFKVANPILSLAHWKGYFK